MDLLLCMKYFVLQEFQSDVALSTTQLKKISNLPNCPPSFAKLGVIPLHKECYFTQSN